jgi:hypothetical protein
MTRNTCISLAAMVLAGIIGCNSHSPPPGPPLAKAFPVHGQVKLAGSPLKGGMVTFTPLEVSIGRQMRFEGSGLVDGAGNFKIGLSGSDSGVPPGEYKVTVQPREYQELRGSNSNKIPNKFRNGFETPLSVTVKEEENQFTFDLK